MPGSCLTPRKTPPSRLQRSERNSAKNSPASEPVKSGARENRKSRTAEFLKTASTDVRILSCADKPDNVKSVIEDGKNCGESVRERFHRPKNDQERYYRPPVEIFRSRAGENKTAAELFHGFALKVKTLFA